MPGNNNLDRDGIPISGNAKWYFNGDPIAVGANAVMKRLDEDSRLFAQVATAVRMAIAHLNGAKASELLYSLVPESELLL